jgi:hypothetical protein
MATLGNKIWYGTFHHEADVHRLHLVPLLVWTALLLASLSVRFLLPFQPTDSHLVHARIVDSLAASQVWGRQALVGSLEFPPLPTLALLFAEQVGQLLRIPGGFILIICAQTWTLFYLLRVPRNAGLRVLAAIPFCCAMLAPVSFTTVLTLDPNWIAAVPVAAAIYHVIQWERYHSLRDAVLLGVMASLLVFAGLAGMLLGLVILLVCAMSVHQMSRADKDFDPRGIRLLIWAPFGYAMLLLFLANWLIMRDPLFACRRVFAAIASADSVRFASLAKSELLPLSWFVIGAIVCVAIAATRRRHIYSFTIIASLVVLTATRTTLAGLQIAAPGTRILELVLVISAFIYPVALGEEKEASIAHWLPAILVAAAAILAAILFTPPVSLPHRLLADTAPHPGLITSWVDQSWPGARIAVHGVRGAAVYHDPEERRFITRIDFQENTLLDQAREEQLYLLVPPRNGHFYAHSTHPLSQIHQIGRPYLLLERTWPGGWQLWRYIMLPDSENWRGTGE